MSTDWMDFFIFVLQQIMTLGIALLAVLLFWHLRRINKPVIAGVFWSVMFLTALTPLFNIIQSGVPFSAISIWYLCPVIIIPLVVIGSCFVNPLQPVRYTYEDEEPEFTD